MATATPSTGTVWSPRKLLLVALAVAVLAAGATVLVAALDRDSGTTTATEGSGVAATEVRDLPPFTAIDLAGVNDVRVGVGGEQRVVVHADDNLVDLVTTRVSAGTLLVDESESFDSTSSLTVEVTVPSLDRATLSGAGVVTVDGHDLEALELVLSGAGALRAAGDVRELTVELGGIGDVELGTLVAEAATVTLTGTGNAHVHVTRSLDARLAGTGTIFYSGDPQSVRREITGTGAVIER